MPSKRVWKSSVARVLTKRQKENPVTDSLVLKIFAKMQKGLSPTDCVSILAQDFRKRSDETGKNNLSPTNLDELCSELGLAVEYQPLSVEALLHERNSGFVAIINSLRNESRQRSSLAHEMGHLILYQATGLAEAFGHVSPGKRDNIESVEIEELCDHFAKELTMPADLWRSLVKAEGLSITTLKKLHQSYGVSFATAAKRLVEIIFIDFAIIVWKLVPNGDAQSLLEPVRCWAKLPFQKKEMPDNIEIEHGDRLPGSPYLAIEKQDVTAGLISLSFGYNKLKFFAHSDIIDNSYVATLIVPQRFGWNTILGNKRSF